MSEHEKEPESGKLLREILSKQERTAAQSAAYATVAHSVKQNDALLRSQRRLEAQVDAMLKARYECCGMPDAYQPPEDDDVSPTLINCSFNGDQAVNQITNALKAIDGGDGGDGGTPDRPNGRWWKWALGLLSAVIIGAGIVFLAYQLFGGGEQYEIVAVPWQPTE